MRIMGFQKLTLLDYPGKVACTIFTPGCNFRCPFCHNASLVIRPDTSDEINQEEVLDYLKKRVGILEGVCITGGEPLMQPDLLDFVKKIKALGYKIKLDTNGSYPQKLKMLVSEGVIDYVAMDIKNSREKYGQTVGVTDLDITPIEESVAFLLEGHVEYEFRTTIVQEYHEVQDIQHIGEWIQGAPKYFLQNFVDSGDLISPSLNPVKSTILDEMKTVLQQYIPNTELRGV